MVSTIEVQFDDKEGDVLPLACALDEALEALDNHLANLKDLWSDLDKEERDSFKHKNNAHMTLTIFRAML